MKRARTLPFALLAFAPLLLLILAVAAALFLRQGGFEPWRVPQGAGSEIEATPERLARGAYLARIGDCQSCHSVRGGIPFVGGRAFPTPWGTLYSGNLTPDPETGLGDWSAEEFRHAMRHGVSRSGTLYPAFPYANFALLEDADLDALWVWLRSQAPVRQAQPANELTWPASWRPLQVFWRMFAYRPADPDFGAEMPAEWRRGRYLVDGLGHCAMCHGRRGPLASLPASGYLAGGRISGSGWYAPALDSQQLARYGRDELAEWLRSGSTEHGATYGPMAEVVWASLQHLTPDDARAIAAFLQSVPPHAPPPSALPAALRARGEGGRALYEEHCKDCHGADGRGKPDRYPALVDVAAATTPDPANLVRLILYGAVPPVTAGNRRPWSMPPFVQTLDAAQIAAIANYVRSHFGGQAPNVSPEAVRALHGIELD